MAKNEWSGRSDGTPFMQCSLIALMRYLDVRVIYVFMAIVIVFYIVFGNRHSRHIYHYFISCHRMPPLKAFAHTYLTYLQFGQAIMDRYAVYAGRHYDMVFENENSRDIIEKASDGLIILASHIGNYEMAGYLLSSKSKRMNVLLYAREQASVTEKRIRHFSKNNINTIIVGDNMDHLFAINKALDNGEIVSFHADRMVNSQKSVPVSVFNRKANLPIGPFLLAASQNKPVVTLFVMKERWNSYKIICRSLSVNQDTRLRNMAADLASQYAKVMEDVALKYPDQWFQFYDFWK